MKVTIKQAQRMLFWFGLRYIPLIGFCSPKIREMSDKHLAVSMPHTWRTKTIWAVSILALWQLARI